MKTNVLPVPLIESLNASTCTLSLPGSNRTLTGSPVHRQSHRSSINDNYYNVSCVAGKVVSVSVTGKGTCTANCVSGNNSSACVSGRQELTGNQDCFVTSKDTVRTLTVNSCSVVNPAHFATGSP